MLSNELEQALNAAFHQARQARHQSLTTEHLLQALLPVPKVREVLTACGARLEELDQALKAHLDATPRLPDGEDRQPAPAEDFQRVLQRAVFHVQHSGGKKDVGPLNVLVALFSQKDSPAVRLLEGQDVTRLKIVNHIAHGSGAGTPPPEGAADGQRPEGEEELAALLDTVLTRAVGEHASHVHVEPHAGRLVIRLRVNGVLREVLSYPRAVAPGLVTRIKAAAGLDVAGMQPQQGRLQRAVSGVSHEVWVATFPGVHGERATLRFPDAQEQDFVSAGMDPDTAARLDELLRRPRGLLLVTGPAGSGRLATLYTALLRLADGTRNVMTLESPITRALANISQTQLGSLPGMSGAEALKALLPQDPDVIMLDTLTEPAAAQLAVQAATRRQLVLVRMEAVTAAGALSALQALGVEPARLAPALLGVLAQRRVRTLDPATRQAFEAGPAERELLGVLPGEPSPVVYRAGAEPGAHAGFTGLYELVTVDATLQSRIRAGASGQELEQHARGAPSLEDAARAKVLAGQISIEEAARALHPGTASV